MTSKLTSEFDQMQLSAHSLANQLADVATMMNTQGQFPPVDLSEKIQQHLKQEKRFRLNLEETARRCHLDLSDPILQAPYAKLKTVLDATKNISRAKSRLEELRTQLDTASCDRELKQESYRELADLDSQLQHPRLPLTEKILRFAQHRDHLTKKIEKLVKIPAAIISPVVLPRDQKRQAPDKPKIASPFPEITLPKPSDTADSGIEKKQQSISGIARPIPDFSSLGKKKQSPVEVTPPAEPVEVDDVAGDLIFDDIKDEVTSEPSKKHILTSTEIENQLKAESLAQKRAAQLEESNERISTTPFAAPPVSVPSSSDSVFDELDIPLASGEGSLAEQLRRESQHAETTISSETTLPLTSEVSAMKFVPKTDYTQAKEYAEKAANSQNRFDRVSFLGHVVWELISLEEYPWAYQVSRALHSNVDNDLTISSPPPWLISLLAMGDQVRLSSGRIAREFNAIATEHRDEAIQISSTPNSPEAFLLRAALMRGTVTTASSTASEILRSYQIEPSQTQTYNYCTRIASFATQAIGLKLDQYFYRPGAASIESEARSVRSQVISWKSRQFEQVLPYQIATPLFSHAYWSVLSSAAIQQPELAEEWRARQNLQSRVARLLQPIVENHLNCGGNLEQEIRHLSHSVLLSEKGTLVTLTATDKVDVAGRELYNFVQEAIEFASHWLVLASSYPGMESVLVPQEVNELRDEIDHRQNSVFMELKHLEKTNATHAQKAALAACRRSMDRINQLFHPVEEPRISEIDPNCLLNADLLKIPGVTLDEDWQCDIAPSTLEHQLLTILKHGVVSWEEAFDQQLKTGCYRAAHQLLKLDLWSDEQREQLKEKLESCRRNHADSLHELASQIRVKIKESKNLEVLSSLEAGKLQVQVESIEERIPTEYRLDHLRVSLTQVWQLLETRKELELKKMQDRMSRLSGQQSQSRSDSELENLNSAQADRLKKEQNRSQADSDSDDESSEGWAIDV